MFKNIYKVKPLFTKNLIYKQFCSEHQVWQSTTSELQILQFLVHKCKFQRNRAEFIIYKCPSILRLKEVDLLNIINTVKHLGFPVESISKNPKIFGMTPAPIKEYFDILKECGFQISTLEMLCNYLTLTRKYTVSDLITKGYIPDERNVAEGLFDIFDDWPISRNNFSRADQNGLSLLDIRMRVLQRYLELILDLPQEDFNRALKSYPRIKHRSLQSIKTVLNMLQDEVLMPVKKIRANLFLLYCDIANLKLLLYKLKKIASVDIKEILRAHPVLCNTTYQTFINTNEVLKSYGINDFAQSKCFEIYSLSTVTVKQRLEEASKIPEFKVLFDHPRILRLIYYRNNALKRLEELSNLNKKCTSLHILSCASGHYKSYEKSPGDRTKGKDLIRGISNQINQPVNEVKHLITRHPFWTNIPIVQAMSVCKNLLEYFSEKEILHNCIVVLYPWQSIESILLTLIDGNIMTLVKSDGLTPSLENLDVSKLTKTQLLSLILYFLERRHYFTGNGVWLDDKYADISKMDSKKVSLLRSS